MVVHWEKYYAIRIEFQETGSPRVHSFIKIFNTLNIQNVAAYIEFIKKIIEAQFQGHLNDPELSELRNIYQVHADSRTCWKYMMIITKPCHYQKMKI